jgi:hypothetical protein
MKWENRKQLRDILVGKSIVDVVYHNMHGLVVDVVLDDNTIISFCTYDDGEKHDVDEFYIGVDGVEL